MMADAVCWLARAIYNLILLCRQVYDCLHHSICSGGQSIVFAWAKNAPRTRLPPGVSFTVDPAVRRYLVLQIHYARALPDPDHTALSLTYQETPTQYQVPESNTKYRNLRDGGK